MKHESVNLDYLKEMSGNDKKLISEMINIFNTEVPGYLDRMSELLKSEDWESLGKLAHKAKASASIMGMGKLTEELRQLEQDTGKKNNTDLYPGYVESIKKHFFSAIQELKTISDNL